MKLGKIEQVVLQSTPACNLNCGYCFLTEKSRKDQRILSPERMGMLFEKIFASRYAAPFLDVVWHSGEPLVLSPEYYAEAIEIISGIAARHHGDDFRVQFFFQTNATPINQAWCDFFIRHKDRVHVGVSCDGPEFLHDSSRRNWAGRGSFEKTQRGMRLLAENGIPFGMIAVVSSLALDHPDEFFDFFHGWRHSLSSFHFNLIEGASQTDLRSPYGRTGSGKYYAFIRRLLERSQNALDASAPLEIQNFSWIFDKLFSSEAVKATYRPENMSLPFRTLNIDVEGNVSTFYAGLWSGSVGDIYRDGQGLSLGNLFLDDLETIAQSAKLKRMHEDFARSHRACESGCAYQSVCSGGFNLTKHKHFGTFDATETPDCALSVKVFTDAVLDDIRAYGKTSSEAGHGRQGAPSR
jgi:uncharacterized protein